MGGSNFSDIPEGGKYTYSERAIPYVQNEFAYHTGTFNNGTYFDKIDAIKNGDMEALNNILKSEGIAEVNAMYFKDLTRTYTDYIADAVKAIGTNIDVTYGLMGKATAWGKMTGGAKQYVTPLGGEDLVRLRIIK